MNTARIIMNLAGSHDKTYRGDPPFPPVLRTRSRGGDENIAASSNDGFELWFGYPNKWKHSISADEARALFWWLLFRWFGQARWFGLRRPIYYWALKRYVRRFQQGGAR